MSKQKHPEKLSEFQELVSGIRATESEADRMKADYDSKVFELLKMGREKSVELREFYEKKAVDAKNRILAEERGKTDKMAEKIIADARKEASQLRGRKLDRKGIDAVFGVFESSL
jgi:vacuolar-type H+-ATPase subunit H